MTVRDEGDLPRTDPETRARIVARAKRAVAPEVHRALVAQNARLAPSAARDANIAALAAGAAAVVTGQQVGLFMGPLYTLYKAASAIAIARALGAETGVPVVPVFWLQTEDHDIVEIATCEVAAGGACESIGVAVDATNRISISELRFGAEIEGCVAALAELLGNGPEASAHVERLRRHYRPGVSWSDAFAGVIGELFAPEGLVVIDPRDPALAAAVAPVHARAVEDARRIADALIAKCEELGRAGRSAQVHVRAGSPLSFFHPSGAQGPRVRLEPAGDDAFVEVGGEQVHTHGAPGHAHGEHRHAGHRRVHTRRQLLAALATDPRCFSTSALLRPIVQDTLLPTAAYIGGPAEVAYFAQLSPLYRTYDLPMPLILERAHFRIVDERARRVLARLGLSAAQLERRSEADVLAQLRRPATDDVVDRLLRPFVAAHDELSARLLAAKPRRDPNASRAANTNTSAATDASAPANPAIARALAKTRGSVERSVRRFAAKLERIAAYDDAELVDTVRRARAWLAPDGELQERRLGLPCFAARLGDRYVVERVLAAAYAAPFDSSVQELS